MSVLGPAPANPFVGLRPFERDEAMLFLGRRRQTLELLDRLHRGRFVAVTGRSGCGKSSLVRAGLIPKLEAGMLVQDRDRWRIAVMTPGNRPRLALAEALAEATGGGDAAALEQAIERGGTPALIDWMAPSTADDGNWLLLVDQFEEIFRFRTGDDAWRDEAADFVSIVLALAGQRSLPAYVVLTMRSDFLSQCDAFPGLPEAMNASLYLVPRLERGEQREAIEGPIRLFGRSASRRLVDRLLNDLDGQPDQLPVLQHALMCMWRGLDGEAGRPIDIADYEAVGGIRDALSRHAEAALEGLDENGRRTTEVVFRALTDTDAQNRRVRRPARVSELAGAAGVDRAEVIGIVERFRSGGRSFLRLSGETTGDPTVDISHESLIRRWDRLSGWVDREARDRATYRRILEAAERWRHYGRDAGALWRDPELASGLAWWGEARPTAVWTERCGGGRDLAQAFLERSREERQARLEKEREEERLRLRRRLMGRFAAALAVLAAAAVALAFSAWSSKLRADRAATQALAAERLAVAAREEAEENRLRAEASRRQAEAELQERERLERAALTTYSPDGSILITVSEAGNPLVWDAEIGVLETSGHVASLVFSPDGRWIATCGDPLVEVWDARTARLVTTLEGHQGQVLKAAFNPRGDLLATAGTDRTARLWDVATGRQLRLFSGFNTAVVEVAFSRDGREILCLAGDRTSRTWTSDTGSFDAGSTTSKLALVRSSSEENRVAEAQKLLESLGRYEGTVDGKKGPATTGAVRGFQESRGMATDGRVSKPLIAALHEEVAETAEPEILAFTALPREVETGGVVKLTWEVLDADAVELAGAGLRVAVPLTGSRSLRIDAPATFALIARKDGVEAKKEIEIQVRENAGRWFFQPEVSRPEGPVRRRDVLERVSRATVAIELGESTVTGFIVNAAGHVLTVQTTTPGGEPTPKDRLDDVLVLVERGDTPLPYRQLGEGFGLERGPLLAVLEPRPGTEVPLDPARPYWLPIGFAERDGALLFDPASQYRLYSPVSPRGEPQPSATKGLFPAVELLAPRSVITAEWILRYRCNYCQDGWRGAPVFDGDGAVWGLHLGHQGGGVRVAIWVYPVLEQYRIWEGAGLLKPVSPER